MLAVDWRGRSVPRSTAISTRLLNETHRRLMRGVRGANKQPGEIRHGQNWIGGTRPGNAVFVPAPPEELPALLTSFEKYLHAEIGLLSLLAGKFSRSSARTACGCLQDRVSPSCRSD